MILITTALRAEARPIIDGLKLKGINKPFGVYANDEYILVITGVGCIKSATGVGWAFGNYDNITGAVNIGTAGGQNIGNGELLIANSVEYYGSNSVQIPDIVCSHGIKECKCITSDFVVKNRIYSQESMLYDMEAYGFMSASGNFLTNDKIAVLKVVSDSVDSENLPSQDDIINFIQSKFCDIRDFLNDFFEYCEMQDVAPSFDYYTNIISNEYRLTKTQKAQLAYELHNSYVYYNALPDVKNLPEVRGNGKRGNTQAFETLLSNIKNNVNSVPAEVYVPKKCKRKFAERIYVEKEIFELEQTKEILANFPKANVVKISHYKNVFNRSKQNFSSQQCGKNIILAKAVGNLVYKGSDYCNAFGFDKFYYCSTVMGCLYSCEYCYLQGIYPSANIVAFVNIEDFFAEIERCTNGERALVCCSYDSDILALDSVFKTVDKWIDFAEKHPEITFEIRTKSANIQPFLQKNQKNMIIAYTVSPECVCGEFEKSSPSLKARFTAADTLAESGWRVRLCMEPILVPIVPENEYFRLADLILQHCENVAYEDIVVGEFRMNKSCYNKIAAQRYYSKLFHNPFAECNREYTTYKDINDTKNKIAEYLRKNTTVKVIAFEYKD